MRIEPVEEGPLTLQATLAAEVLWRRLEDAANYAWIGLELRGPKWEARRAKEDTCSDRYLKSLRALGRKARTKSPLLASLMRQEARHEVMFSLCRVNPELANEEAKADEAALKEKWRKIREQDEKERAAEAAVRLKRDLVPNGGREPVFPRVYSDEVTENDQKEQLNGTLTSKT
jgi:hypothetical protein